ncbi:MAG: MFS transporter [Deltaproteobacteria bacterium]|nr:MAG: MFS transporter [Deltaproteobacteria bacterium]
MSRSGHPKGLAPLFFTEMWERLAFYTMVNVLLLYATDAERGGLGLSSAEGNEIYGLYLAFVYFTPFPGGLAADRYLGYRRAVVVGGLLMAAGLFLMSIPGWSFFVAGLCGLILGNGFFKPNISVMVGNLYAPGDPRRDAGFNIFYMGINIGAFVAAFLSSYVRGSFGWLWTFRTAAIGLLVGLAILLLNWKTLEAADRRPERNADDVGFGAIFVRILLPAFGAGIVGFVLVDRYFPGAPVTPGVAGFLAGMIPVLAFFVRLPRTAAPEERPGLRALLPVYLAGGTFFMVLHLNGSAMTQWARDQTDRDVVFFDANKLDAFPSYYVNAPEDTPRPDPRSLLVVDDPALARMFGQQRLDTKAVDAIAAADRSIEVVHLPPTGNRDPKDPVERLSVDVYPEGTVELSTSSDGHGGTIVTAKVPEGARPTDRVAFVRTVEGRRFGTYVVDRPMFEAIYEGYARRYGHPPDFLPPGVFLRVVAPEMYQSLNALFVVALTPVVVWFFGAMVRRGRPISTARKVFYGLSLTALALLLMAVAGLASEGGAVKVSSLWLVGFYAIVTLGELCLSPMGLSAVTKLAPKRLTGLAMGGWFMATAFGNNLSGFFGGIQSMLSPVAFFLTLAAIMAAVAGAIYAMLPWLDETFERYGA